MQFGWLTLSLSPSPDEDAQRIDNLIEQACGAERLGFSDVWLTEHYFTGESVYSDSLMFAAALAMKTERIRIGFAVVQMPFHHPVRLAVQLALLDNLSKGRIDVGLGKGTIYNEYEFVGHGLRSDDSRERMTETLDVMVRAWTEAPLVHHGKFYDLSLPELRPRPRQRPHPPIWRAVSSAGSVRECGRLGAPILIARVPLARVPERLALYADGLEESGLDAATRAGRLRQAALWRFVHVAGSQAQAEDELAAALHQGRHHSVHARATHNPPDFQVDASRVNPWNNPRVSDDEGVRYALEQSSLYGTAARVAEQVAALREAGVGHVLCQMTSGEMPHATSLASMRDFGEQVMPRFR